MLSVVNKSGSEPLSILCCQ